MGFFTKNNKLYLPHKRMTDDILERDGESDEFSYTPYEGMRHLIKRQMLGKYQNVPIDIIKESLKEINLSKVKSRNKDDLDLVEIDYYGRTLEEIPEEDIMLTIDCFLIGSKLQNDSDVKDVVYQDSKVQPLMRDDESGDYYYMSDTAIVEDNEIDFEIDKIKNKIVFLLNVLHEGSKIYNVSLLELFIAIDALRLRYGRNTPINPRGLLVIKDGFHKVTSEGVFLPERYTYERNANSNSKFITVRNIVLGDDPNNKYYKAGVELTELVDRIGFRLGNEIGEKYDNAFMNNVHSEYIMSNLEVMDELKNVDRNIINMFKEGTLFSNVENVMNNSTTVDFSMDILKSMAKSKMYSVDRLYEVLKENKMDITIRDIHGYTKLFLEAYKIVHAGKPNLLEETKFEDFKIVDHVICNDFNQPFVFNCDAFCFGYRPPKQGWSKPWFILTDRGYAVLIDDNLDQVFLSDVREMVYFYNGKSLPKGEYFEKEPIVLW